MFSLSFLYFPFSLPVPPSTGPTPGWTILSLTPSTTPDYTTKLCGRFVSHLFTCPDVPLPWHLPLPVQPQLDHYIAYALHRMVQLRPPFPSRQPSLLPLCHDHNRRRIRTVM